MTIVVAVGTTNTIISTGYCYDFTSRVVYHFISHIVYHFISHVVYVNCMSSYIVWLHVYICCVQRVQCTLTSVHIILNCTSYCKLNYTLYTVQYTVYDVQCTIHTVHGIVMRIIRLITIAYQNIYWIYWNIIKVPKLSTLLYY